jgi:acyl-coenzyme A thioesterase PaaI-like protein
MFRSNEKWKQAIQTMAAPRQASRRSKRLAARGAGRDVTRGTIPQQLGDKHPADTAERVLQRFARMGTIDLRVDFLRQGVGKHFVASAEVTRLGGRVGSTQMRLVRRRRLHARLSRPAGACRAAGCKNGPELR